MKRILIHIILSLLILFSNSGWVISFHYCHNELASISLEYGMGAVAEEGCAAMDSCCGDEEEEDNCCDDASVSSSTSDSLEVVKAFSLHLPIFVLSGESFVLLNADVAIASVKGYNTDFYSCLGGLPLYALYCQRVFYA